MAEKKNLKYIKTAQDLSAFNTAIKEYMNRNKTYSELMDYYAIDPDFDLDMFYKAQGYDDRSNDFYDAYFNLVSNTVSGLNKKQKDEFANRLGDSLKSYWDLVYNFGGAEKWNRDELKTRAQYLPYEVVFHAADKRDLFHDEAFLFKKTISPDNQVLLRNSFVNYYDYNFSNQRMQEPKISMPFLPKGNTHGLYGNDKHLFEKFEKDFGRAFDPKTAFRDAEHADVLFELRSGKIHPTLAMPKLNSSDFKYIIPKNDFKDLSASEVYDILSARDVRWEQWQVASMMEMIVDKVPDVDNTAYLNQIMEIINVNNKLFLKDTENNHKLWLKIEDKFKDAAQQNREYKETLKVSIEKLRANIEKESGNLDNLLKKRNYLEYSEKRKNEALQARMESVRDFGGDYYKRNSAVIKKALDDVLNGKFEKLSEPEKPWKLFGFDKEKQQYEKLLELIDIVNMYMEFVKDMRDKEFGQHEFNSWSMQRKLQTDISRVKQSLDTDKRDIQYNERVIRAKEPVEFVKEKADAQKSAKKVRMEKAKAKLMEKGVVLGQKSGVIEADKKAQKIIYDKAIDKMMKKLRATSANEKKSDKELMEIAKRLVAENQK